MSDRGNNVPSAATTLETVSEKPLPEFARFVSKPCPPSDCDMHNPRKTQMPHFPRVSRGFSMSTTRPLENATITNRCRKWPKNTQRKSISGKTGKIHHRWGLDAGRGAGSREQGQSRDKNPKKRDNLGQEWDNFPLSSFDSSNSHRSVKTSFSPSFLPVLPTHLL